MAFLLDHNVVPDIVAVIGVLVFGAGIHLLWKSRREIFSWVEEYFRLFRMSVKQVADHGEAPVKLPPTGVEKKHAVRIAMGFMMAFAVAPLLVILGLAF